MHPVGKLILAFGIGLLSVACDVFEQVNPSGASDSDDALVIAVIPPSTSGWYWRSFISGIETAERELAEQGKTIDLALRGPLRDQDSEYQNQATRDFIARGVNGLVIAPTDAQSLAATLQESSRTCPPVVIVGRPFNETHTLSKVLTDDYQLGRQLAEYLVRRLNGNDGVMTLFGTSPSNPETDLRVRGFLDQLKLVSPSTLLLTTNWVEGSRGPAVYRAASDALDQLSLHTNLIQSVFCPDETATVMMSLARKNGETRVQNTLLLGYGESQRPLEALRRGEITALGAPQPALLGQSALSAMVEHLESRPVQREIRCPGLLLTAENLGSEPVLTLLAPLSTNRGN